jgi:uncharacterized protein YxeA
VLAVSSYALLMAVHYSIENYMESQAFYIVKAHTIKGLNDFQKVYFNSEIKEEKTKITYELTVSAFSPSGKKTQAKICYDCTRLFDTHGYLHLLQVHEHLVSPAIQTLVSGIKKA